MQVAATTVGGAIAELQTRFPGIKERLTDDAGAVRRFVNVYVNEEDIRFLQNQDTALKDGDESASSPPLPAANHTMPTKPKLETTAASG